MRKRIINAFLDVLVLDELRTGTGEISGYNFLFILKRKFGVMLASATMYSRLYYLERQNLIKGLQVPGKRQKRVYDLTDEGKEWMRGLTSNPDSMVQQLLKLLAVPR